jgi:hypothetical protein
MKNTKILVGLLLAYSLNSCSLFGDTEPQLPPETQEGKNTFGCLINGKVWIPYFGGTDIYNTQATKAGYSSYQNGTFSIRATKYPDNKINKDYQHLSIGIIGTPVQGQEYIFRNDDILQLGDLVIDFLDTNKSNFCISMGNLSYFKGKTTITKFDLRSRIAAGTFEFMLKSKDCIDTLKVTQGRFDMTF